MESKYASSSFYLKTSLGDFLFVKKFGADTLLLSVVSLQLGSKVADNPNDQRQKCTVYEDKSENAVMFGFNRDEKEYFLKTVEESLQVVDSDGRVPETQNDDYLFKKVNEGHSNGFGLSPMTKPGQYIYADGAVPVFLSKDSGKKLLVEFTDTLS